MSARYRFFCVAIALWSATMFFSAMIVAQSVVAEARGRGYPWISLSDAQEVLSEFEGDAQLAMAAEFSDFEPLTLAAADFNEDGIPDLVCGYASPDGGALILHLGTLRADHAFQRGVRIYGLPVEPQFLETGDFDGDGLQDVVLARFDSHRFWFLAGRNKVGFDTPQPIELPGPITAIESGDFGNRDGLDDLMVGVDGAGGPALLVYQNRRGALRGGPRTLDLPAAASHLAIGQLDDRHPADLAVAAGSELIVFYGESELSPDPPNVTFYPQAKTIAAMTLADLEQDSEKEIVLLFEDGSLNLYSQSGSSLEQAPSVSTIALPQLVSEVSSASKGFSGSRFHLEAVRVSTSPKDDLLLLTPGSAPLRILTRAGRRFEVDSSSRDSNPVRSFELEARGQVAAVLPLRLTKHALDALVVLLDGDPVLSVLRPVPVNIFTVNDAGTDFDGNAGDGVCAAAPCEGGVCSGPCTLRAAINEANESPGHDEIRFSVASIERPDGEFGINFITESLTLDGCGGSPGSNVGCEPGAGRTELRELQIGLNASDTVIQGLVMNNERGLQGGLATQFRLILLDEGVQNCHIVANYLGTDITGKVSQGGAGSAIQIHDSSNNTIGGANERLRNVIAGSRSHGIVIRGTSAQNKILGNYIGTDASGMEAVPNGTRSFDAGIRFEGSGTGNEVGGAEPGAGNLISGNVGVGVLLQGFTDEPPVTGQLVLGNRIGVNASETGAVANTRGGISLSNASENTIGGLTAGAGNFVAGNQWIGVRIHDGSENLIQGNEIGRLDLANTSNGLSISGESEDNKVQGNAISYNTGIGVFIGSGTGHSISQNSIFENGFLGIDLSPGGVTPNDTVEGDEDVDSGPNNLQNFPHLTGAGNGRINWTFSSRTAQNGGVKTYRLEFFGNTFCDTSTDERGTEFGEGESFLTSDDIPLPEATVSGTTFVDIPPRIQAITATATELIDGKSASTSEFSNCIPVQVREAFIVNSTRDLEDNNPGDGICATGENGFPDQVGFGSCPLEPECTLRAAIMESNALPGADKVQFEIPVCDHGQAGVGQSRFPIRPDGRALEPITEPLTIEGNTQAGSGPALPVVELDGSQAGSGADGFLVTGGGTTITGFIINRFSGAGIRIRDEGNNAVLGNYIGTDYLGTTFLGNERGVVIENSSENRIGDNLQEISTSIDNRLSFLESNLISGNRTDAIRIVGVPSTLNQIRGNLIGTTLAARCLELSGEPVTNSSGVRIEQGMANRIGPANLISCQYILTAVTLDSATEIQESMGACAIGDADRLVGSCGNAIVLERSAAGNHIIGNRIGTGFLGLTAIGKNGGGVLIQDGSRGNFVGGTLEQERNLIAGNGGSGVEIRGQSATDNHIVGNFLGTDVTGEFALVDKGGTEGNPSPIRDQVTIFSSSGNCVGGPTPQEGNLIAGVPGSNAAVHVLGDSATNNLIQNNFIGTNKAGERVIVLGVGAGELVWIDGGNENKILDNLISGALSAPFASPGFRGGEPGIRLNGNNNLVQGNLIGTDITGQKALGNGVGILVQGNHNTIGGPGPGQKNTISGNDKAGIVIEGGDGKDRATNTKVLGNHIGTNPEGSAAVPNLAEGVLVARADSNQIGGLGPGEGNLISGNGGTGVFIRDGSDNFVYGNRIGTDATGLSCLDEGVTCQTGLGNKRSGIFIRGDNNVVGWAKPDNPSVDITGKGAGNTIAFNGQFGVAMARGDGNSVRANRIYRNEKGAISASSGLPSVPILKTATVEKVVGSLFRLRTTGLVWSNKSGATLDFYASPQCGVGAATYIGSYSLPPSTLSDRGFQSRFDFRSQFAVDAGSGITATTTAPGRSTSSLSMCLIAALDTDADGSPDAVDSAPENNREATTKGGYTLSSEAGSRLEIQSPAGLDTAPVGISVLERIRFRVSSDSSGDSSSALAHRILTTSGESFQVTVELPFGVLPTTYYNFGPTPDDPSLHWYEFLFDGSTGAEILSDRIILHFIDGQRGDHDLVVNGEITTSGGPSLLADLLFPFYQAQSGTFVGFAVSNFSEDEAGLQFWAFDPDGIPLEGTNPAPFQLAPGTQLALLGNEIFELPPAGLQFGWVQLDTDNPRLGSFFLFGGASKLDGSVALSRQSKRFYFTRIFSGPSGFRGQMASTLLAIANPNSEQIEVELTLNGPTAAQAADDEGEAGSTGSKVTRMIAGKGFLSAKVSSLFNEGVESGGYVIVEVTEGAGAVGFELVEIPERNTVIGLNASVATEDVQLFSAQLAEGPGIFTNLKLVNVGGEEAVVSVWAVGEDGTPLAEAAVLKLGPGQSVEQDVFVLLEAANQELGGSQATVPLEGSFLIGSLQVSSTRPGVIGDVIFGDPDNFQFGAALPLQAQLFREAVFSQVANVRGFFTGLALYNPGEEEANVTVEVFSAEAGKTGEAQLVLAPGARLSKLLTEIVPSTGGQAGGYIRIVSTQGLVAQALFGAGGSLLSAVPPTIVR